jgi:hypothetical protein
LAGWQFRSPVVLTIRHFSLDALLTFWQHALHRIREMERAMTEQDRAIAEALAPLIAVAETAEDWAEICRREAEMKGGAPFPKLEPIIETVRMPNADLWAFWAADASR